MGKGWKSPIKAANAQKKGAAFTKLAREIQVAAKMGGADPNMNARLRLAIEVAKKNQCPNDTIERAVKKGAGLLEGAQVDELTYEGYGPHGIGVIVECQSDNKNRTVPEIRQIFKDHEGNMGETGSVAWMFERVGLLEGSKTGSFDPDEEAIEAGADEVSKNEDGGFSFYSAYDAIGDVQKALAGRGWTITTAEPAFKPKNITDVNEEQMKDIVAFLDELDEHDDTHRVYATLKN